MFCNILRPSHYMKGDGPSSDEDGASRKSYELDELDLAWLDCVTNATKFRGRVVCVYDS